MRGLENFNIASFEAKNKYGFPEIFPCKLDLDLSYVSWIDFDTALSETKRDKLFFEKYNGLHFYIDDYKFQRLWNYPQRYIDFLRRFDYVVMPDFSLYYNFPQALQIYNKYRNHWLAAYLSVNDVNVIPDISLSTPDCFYWSLEAYPSNSLLAFCDVGSKRDKSSREVIPQAFEFMRSKLNPLHVIYFTRSKSVDFEDDNITVVRLPFFRSKGGDFNG